MRRIAIATAFAAVCFAAQAQQHELIGRWNSIDQPGKWVEFHASGQFDYIYSLGPPLTRLELRWKTGWFSSLTLSSEAGGAGRDCKYKISGDDLTLDDGDGKSCIENRPVVMAMKFKRVRP